MMHKLFTHTTSLFDVFIRGGEQGLEIGILESRLYSVHKKRCSTEYSNNESIALFRDHNSGIWKSFI